MATELMRRKGIILAGGSGQRLDPVTRAVNKHLLPVYDTPMIYFPICTLMGAGVREIVVVTGPRDMERFVELLGDGSQWGIALEYAIQEQPRGIAEAFLVARDQIEGRQVALCLGDNLFWGAGLTSRLQRVSQRSEGALIFARQVHDPSAFGVVELDSDGRVLAIAEKPLEPRSKLAVPGLYFYDQDVGELASSLSLSPRGELEITELNRCYLQRGMLCVEQLGPEVSWFDCGTAASLHEASTRVREDLERHCIQRGCPEELALRLNLIEPAEIRAPQNLGNSSYSTYLLNLLERVSGSHRDC
tara:strand:- start:2659 stop:3567 length:909 start_codon:yes stop_codon:yes gene_type:complete